MVTSLLAIIMATGCAEPDLEHRAWTALLGRYVEEGRVDYAALKATGMPELEAYLTGLDAICPRTYETMSRDDRLALLLNAYNAHVVRLIGAAYPTNSIRDLEDPFRRPVIGLRAAVRGSFSLDTLENELIRKGFAEPRIHFALVCGAVSCPALRAEAFVGRRLAEQLEDQTQRFLHDASKNRFDPGARALELSPIFEWFRADFEKRGSVRSFVAERLGAEVLAADVAIRVRDYDWRLNDVRRSPASPR